jgi:hypothetical protein
MAEVIPFRRFGQQEAVAYTSFILARLSLLTRQEPNDANKVEIDRQRKDGSRGVNQARVRLAGDPTVYRLILAPADAPVQINGVPADDYFSSPLESA